jgi:hypothetical protein
VREVAAASGLEELPVISLLGKLAEAGVILLKGERRSRSGRDAELQAHRDSVWAEVSQLLDLAAEAEPVTGSGHATGPAGPVKHAAQ